MSLKLSHPSLFRQQCFIHNEWLSAKNLSTIDVINPATNEKLGTVPNMGIEETERAIEAAASAGTDWKEKTAKERAALLRKWYELIILHADDLAVILTAEQGKPFQEARNEIIYGASFVEWFAEEAKRVYGDVIPSPKKDQHYIVIKQPIGVVAAITPWNFPCAMITRKCAPALAAGCTIVLKPSSLTPFTALALGYLAQRAGIPAGVINIITGASSVIGNVLTSHPNVRKLSFTGSTDVGKLLMAQAAGTIKKVSLELGGNAPFIVFDDADIDAAIKGLMASKFRNMGQTCICANRIYVQETIYAEFAEKLTQQVKLLRVGNGFDHAVEQGPLINLAAIEKVEAHIIDAKHKGAKVLCGGERHHMGDNFFQPTVLTEVNSTMQIAHEETFGPVAPLFRFRDENNVVQLANATPFGLAAYFYSQNIHRIWRVAERLEYGMIGINAGILSSEMAPFGGVKESGIGREGSKYGINEFLEIKNLCMGAPE